MLITAITIFNQNAIVCTCLLETTLLVGCRTTRLDQECVLVHIVCLEKLFQILITHIDESLATIIFNEGSTVEKT